MQLKVLAQSGPCTDLAPNTFIIQISQTRETGFIYNRYADERSFEASLGILFKRDGWYPTTVEFSDEELLRIYNLPHDERKNLILPRT